MKKDLYLGGEKVDEPMVPLDFTDFLISFVRSLLGGKK